MAALHQKVPTSCANLLGDKELSGSLTCRYVPQRAFPSVPPSTVGPLTNRRKKKKIKKKKQFAALFRYLNPSLGGDMTSLVAAAVAAAARGLSRRRLGGDSVRPPLSFNSSSSWSGVEIKEKKELCLIYFRSLNSLAPNGSVRSRLTERVRGGQLSRRVTQIRFKCWRFGLLAEEVKERKKKPISRMIRREGGVGGATGRGTTLAALVALMLLAGLTHYTVTAEKRQWTFLFPPN
ncbi:hypothetical protein DAPPUDRAFT_239216 [Daphnia pulex]|uniref:Uncharacterized protein n=1 Tax=Daphnia pulex TaxID=6669 RepID=E9G8N3_DAPPU|nr:hypothetical protein DAPPUDRAFT_239216 [Daphnia pulex]|eukprot:EFX84000.1 hypothetical protein DAPPUDRAFT_239216 [Daphnia pulex]